MQLNNANLFRQSAYCNAEWQSNSSTFEVTNPANDKVIAKVAEITALQLESTVTGAHLAFNQWQQTSGDHRAKLLRRWFDLINQNIDDLALIMTAEQGKPLIEAVNEINYGAQYLEWYCEQAKRISGELLPVNKPGRRAMVLKRPVGVVAAITPWNFPSAMILRKAAAALAAGCSFIVKPSELTPLSALALAELADQAGIPAGVFNVVVGSNAQAIGEILTGHPKIAKFSFTGSTQVGRKLLAQCAPSVKRTSLELGGNAPFIVFEDADLKAAVKGAIASKFRNAGQTCVSANRFLVHDSIHDEFVAQLKSAVEKFNLGPGDDPAVDIGPLINQKAIEKIDGLLENATQSGATIEMGGGPLKRNGNFYQPTILTNIKPEMAIFSHEIFGPVVSVMRFSDEAQALKLANQTEYGLSAYVYTNNLSRIWRLSEQLEFGMVGINEGVLSNAAAPFGGVKQSGMGREGGSWGIDEYLETRYVCLGGID